MDLISATCVGVGFAREATSMERIQRLIAFTFYRLGCDQQFLKGTHSVYDCGMARCWRCFQRNLFQHFQAHGCECQDRFEEERLRCRREGRCVEQIGILKFCGESTAEGARCEKHSSK